MNNSLTHYGIKGMRWGIRRTPEQLGHTPPSRSEKKEVNRMARGLRRSEQGSQLVFASSVSKFDAKDYERLDNLMSTGRLLVNAKFMPNYEQRAVDLYVGGQKTPTMRIKMTNAKEFSAKFLDEADAVRYDKFVDYHEKRSAAQLRG